VRINAENPARNFMPSPGDVVNLRVPGGPGVRFDTLLFPGYKVPVHYDSLLGKLIVHDQSRSAALARMKRALAELHIEGIHTTTPMHRRLVDHDDVIAGRFDTGFLETWLSTHPL
jgi:acetyl-CoA carboxylase biotin carboxylase subunit